MNIYKISCTSDCGTYFVPYLQSITVIANNQTNAIEKVKEWMNKNDEKFIKTEKHWNITELVNDISTEMVIDYVYESDY